ncbi:MAG: hypothetical protein JWM25_1445 [Thermoleophilia bacterium]|nr:hypothetical protein [Thermoleophilia bacterium]MCZ4496862.1 hypothetical protein [Thermoleophilia bacterium]
MDGGGNSRGRDRRRGDGPRVVRSDLRRGQVLRRELAAVIGDAAGVAALTGAAALDGGMEVGVRHGSIDVRSARHATLDAGIGGGRRGGGDGDRRSDVMAQRLDQGVDRRA